MRKLIYWIGAIVFTILVFSMPALTVAAYILSWLPRIKFFYTIITIIEIYWFSSAVVKAVEEGK